MRIIESKELILTQKDLEMVLEAVDPTKLSKEALFIINSIDASAQSDHDVIIKPYGWSDY